MADDSTVLPQTDPVQEEGSPAIAEEVDPTALLIEAMDIIGSLTEKCQEWQQRYQTEVIRVGQLEQMVQQLEHLLHGEVELHVSLEGRVNELEEKIEEQRGRISQMAHAFSVAFDRLWHGVSHFPSGRTRRVITRARVQYMIYREHLGAITRGLRG